ncbi:MAG: hypothetical protein A3A96_01505 [Candidatus Zambryskibacteria bacterium RIFCSPLOWO2_01_FULL_39_39]|uniref:Uncharacterized protein n=2 Tax=Patescibacteria group TaxID=1783273 RepID=A0A1G2TZU6_9BACT|nr:MAG: hypothetical protein UT61_C0019G0001 [Candidatus Woesebacteria bacterium GW2011_GWA1_39_8]OHA86664.1 MAG: hypothetical protein A2644_03115 [Candidatus Zambryskibacteria bacterium RIFCSPHIGHO2_01_FULL_39_63]OHA95238.1 MAG: hypothetical protein A3B88_02885 [Candidatus Zambryskibacteria bacterium RIFCSPHIGHO2_02_FULL_39_19]OHA98832.1 MAG: hypothetical protein A3F20_02155 [Candidatus Zambryskibacteria bacterium RIFCSPHIGHO2_12_FULL_39_21]OHB02797.1 MAG: hypothetical protein A3A96_01505 [Can
MTAMGLIRSTILMKFVRDTISGPRRKLKVLMPELLAMREELRVIRKLPPLSGVTKFFEVVSPWQNRFEQITKEFRAVNYGQYDEEIKLLEVLANYFKEATNTSKEAKENETFARAFLNLYTKSIPDTISLLRCHFN